MSSDLQESSADKPRHPWLRKVRFAFVPGPTTPLLNRVSEGILNRARVHGHEVQPTPDATTDAILTTASFGEVLDWRETLQLTARRRFGLESTPAVYTLVNASMADFERLLKHFEIALSKDPLDPADYSFPGLVPQAADVLYALGRRGGPIMALERLVQSQAKCIRVILVLGEDEPLAAYHFDLVGSHPRSDANTAEGLYDDILLRTVTTVCTSEVTEHRVVGEPIPYGEWSALQTPAGMRRAGQELGRRNFFTDMVRISDLVSVPTVGDTVAEQYSEGCFSTWDPILQALIATVTGSARPVDKTDITEEDLAVIVGVRSDGKGALARHVEGKRNSAPSSEALEMIDMDSALPTIELGQGTPVPVTRSKLHGHRGISAYHPSYVEFVPLQSQYYHYIVSCATGAQAQGIRDAFSRSEALRNHEDPRSIVFTVLPGHGVVVAEKWVQGKAPFQVIWECMDSGYLNVDRLVPQGAMSYVPGPDRLMVLETD